MTEILLVRAIVRRENNGRHRRVDQRDRAMLHLPAVVAFRMHIGDFLQLECTLKRHGKVISAPEIKEMLVSRKILCEFLDRVGLGQNFLCKIGKFTQSIQNTCARRTRHSAHSS